MLRRVCFNALISGVSWFPLMLPEHLLAFLPRSFFIHKPHSRSCHLIPTWFTPLFSWPFPVQFILPVSVLQLIKDFMFILILNWESHSCVPYSSSNRVPIICQGSFSVLGLEKWTEQHVWSLLPQSWYCNGWWDKEGWVSWRLLWAGLFELREERQEKIDKKIMKSS